MTESHSGSDLGMIRTKAEPLANGAHAITGSKVFISAGDHQMANNIIHLVLADQGTALKSIIGQVIPAIAALPESFSETQQSLQKALKDWGDMAMSVGAKAMQNPDEIGAAAFDFLMYSGYICAAWQWAKMATVANKKVVAGEDSDGFYQTKLQTAQFYFDRILPRIRSHKACLHSGSDNLMSMNVENF